MGNETSNASDKAGDKAVPVNDNLQLGGEPLPLGNLIQTGWVPGQRFSAEDDPDRVKVPWVPPAFFASQDPVQRSAETKVEHYDIAKFLSRSNGPGSSFARVVHDVFTEEECVALIAAINEKGFTPALINVGRGFQRYRPSP